ncbi:fimbria/pilus periplasmic chaperone [Proteus mirabilis]|uniref:fimbria/pilus periplasmic chaperone n=1 Tax=Proteus mirabilis TaxID=584 RepID=UPI001E2A8278|nr:fimbria/pilus periplasmic chaperone [Proteus mirabilis]
MIRLAPNDKFTQESVYRVNIKVVPVIDDEMADKNLLLISLNSIYNLFYTPSNIINKSDNKDIDILNERITLSPFKNYSIKNKNITKNIKDRKVHWKRVDEYEQTIIATPKELIYE